MDELCELCKKEELCKRQYYMECQYIPKYNLCPVCKEMTTWSRCEKCGYEFKEGE
jgi:hypothetical protein